MRFRVTQPPHGRPSPAPVPRKDRPPEGYWRHCLRNLASQVASTEPRASSTKPCNPLRYAPAPLRLWRGAFRSAGLAHLYGTFGMAFLRGCYHQVLGPRRNLAKLADGLGRHANVFVRLNLHRVRQATERHLERGNVSGFASHLGFLRVLCLRPQNTGSRPPPSLCKT